MLGIIDWGIGGISIYKLIKDQLRVPVVYFSDTGVTPYGKMSRHDLAARLDLVIGFLKGKGATHVIIGCNAASTAIGDLTYQGIPVEGVIEPAVAMTAALSPARLGLIGGRRTVTSGVYRRAFREVGIEVKQRIAQPLSALIESGDLSSETLSNAARTILAPLRDRSHILLACTHYPAITPLLKRLVPPAVEFIDPAAEMVAVVGQWRILGGRSDLFYTSGDARAMKRAAEAAFDVSPINIRRVTI